MTARTPNTLGCTDGDVLGMTASDHEHIRQKYLSMSVGQLQSARNFLWMQCQTAMAKAQYAYAASIGIEVYIVDTLISEVSSLPQES